MSLADYSEEIQRQDWERDQWKWIEQMEKEEREEAEATNGKG